MLITEGYFLVMGMKAVDEGYRLLMKSENDGNEAVGMDIF